MIFRQTFKARRQRQRWLTRILGFFGAIDADVDNFGTLRTPWGFNSRQGYGGISVPNIGRDL